jgi:hypothetical protein
MRTLLMVMVFSVSALASIAAQTSPERTDLVGTWAGPARCQHGDGETITLVISRDAEGKLQGATDWARSTSDGRHGPAQPFTTMTVKGDRISASTIEGGRTLHLSATVRGDTVEGHWSIDGGDDRWTFAATRQMASPAAAPRR